MKLYRVKEEGSMSSLGVLSGGLGNGQKSIGLSIFKPHSYSNYIIFSISLKIRNWWLVRLKRLAEIMVIEIEFNPIPF